jgi:hypothetical protein
MLAMGSDAAAARQNRCAAAFTMSIPRVIR